jgi:hypothetical protein
MTIKKSPLVFFSLITLSLTIILGLFTVSSYAGVDELRGQWDINLQDENGESVYSVTLFLNDIAPDPNDPEELLSAGCMKSNEAGFLAPLSLIATQTDDGYIINFFSTALIDEYYQPFVIEFNGDVIVNGRGVKDDEVSGSFYSEPNSSTWEGSWSGIHHDRRRKKCPPVEIPPLSFWGDVRLQKNLRGETVELKKTILEAQTDIVSSGVLVENPDGSTIILPPFTDIFSPDVDFVSRFRYVIPFDEADENDPIAGEPYYFTLLDLLGNPIPGATTTDIWTECLITAPSNIKAKNLDNKDIEVKWDPVDLEDGFDPANGIGFYQIEIGGSNPWTPDKYGSNHIKSIWHIVPWGDFNPGYPGVPDGNDLGEGLSHFPDGEFSIRVEAFSRPPSGSGGFGHECVVVDFDENRFFKKEGDTINIIPFE